MEMKTVTFKTYRYSELEVTAKNMAANNLIKFYIEAVSYESMSPRMRGACDKAGKMRTPWFTGEYIWDDCQKELEEELEDGVYLGTGDVFSYQD